MGKYDYSDDGSEWYREDLPENSIIEKLPMSDNIYSSVPEEVFDRNEKEFQTRQLILEFLKHNKNKYFKATKIAEIFSLPKKSTQVQVRHLITQLIELDYQPIVSSSKGFAYTDKPELIIEYIGSLVKRNKGITRRVERLKTVYFKMTNDTKNL